MWIFVVLLCLAASELSQVIFNLSGVSFPVASQMECWYSARAINVNPLRGTICILTQATGEHECNMLDIGCFAELNTSNNFNSFFRVFSSFNYSSYEEPTEICFSCFSNMPNYQSSTIKQCIYSLSNLEVVSMAIYNLNIYTRIPMGPVIINTLDFSNCYESNSVIVMYDHLTSELTVRGKPTYTCTALTRSQLLKIGLYMNMDASVQFIFDDFDIAKFSFNVPDISDICTSFCREHIFAVTERPHIDGMLTLDFRDSIYGDAMRFPVQKIYSSRGRNCFTNLLTTIAPYYIGTSIELLQIDECLIINIPDEQIVQIQVLVFNNNYSLTTPIFQWTSYRKFYLLTHMGFLYTICHDESSFSLMCNTLTQLISSDHIITSEIVLSFPNYSVLGRKEDIVLRYPVPNTKLGVWGFFNAYVDRNHILFISQKFLHVPMGRLVDGNTSENDTTVLMNVYLQSKSLNNLTRIMTIRVPIVDLSSPMFKLYCSDPSNFLVSLCMEWLARLRKDEASYVMLITFVPNDDHNVESSYLVTFISINPVLNDLLWQILLLGVVIYIFIVIEVAVLLFCEKDREGAADPNNRWSW